MGHYSFPVAGHGFNFVCGYDPCYKQGSKPPTLQCLPGKLSRLLGTQRKIFKEERKKKEEGSYIPDCIRPWIGTQDFSH